MELDLPVGESIFNGDNFTRETLSLQCLQT